MSQLSTPDGRVRGVVAEADRRFRTRRSMQELARTLPMAGGLALAVALVSRLAGWPAVVPVMAMVALAAALWSRSWFLRRRRPSTDGIAARVDAEAALQGELRSAHWFASGAARDAWADYHLDHAASRADQVAWDEVYPAVRFPKSWAAATTLAGIALAVTFVAPGRAFVGPSGNPALAELATLAGSLPPELQKRLEELLASMGDGQLSAEDAKKTSWSDLADLLASIDPELQKRLAELAKERQVGSDETKRRDLDEEDQAEREYNTAAGMPEDVRWALEDLAARLANANANRQTAENNPSASGETGETAMGSAQADVQQASAAENGMQLMREAASDAGAAQMMMAGGAMGGDSSAGAGGNQGNNPGDARFDSIAQALRRELIEASADTPGTNVATDDIRRKTEQGTSALGFTRVAPPATFDRSRATGPPAVPDARRPLLYQYFIRPR